MRLTFWKVRSRSHCDILLGARCWIYILARCYQRTWNYQLRWEIFGCVWSVVRQDCKYPCVVSAFGPNRLCVVRSTADIYFMQQVEALNGTLRAAKRQKKVTILKFAGYIDDWRFLFRLRLMRSCSWCRKIRMFKLSYWRVELRRCLQLCIFDCDPTRTGVLFSR